MKAIISALLCTLSVSTTFAAESQVYGNWVASDSIDEFTQKKSCSVITKASDAGKYDTQVLTVQYGGKMINDSGELIDSLGMYLETKYSAVMIDTPDVAQVLIDGARHQYGSDAFIDAAKNGTNMTVRINDDNGRVYTRKFSLSGFTAAWADVASRCSHLD